MARVNVDILGISELKWTGMGEFNSDDHYIYYCGQESLRRNGVAIMVNKSLKCIQFSSVQSLSRVQLLVIPWIAAYRAPPSMGFSRQEYWSGVPLPLLPYHQPNRTKLLSWSHTLQSSPLMLPLKTIPWEPLRSSDILSMSCLFSLLGILKYLLYYPSPEFGVSRWVCKKQSNNTGYFCKNPSAHHSQKP